MKTLSPTKYQTAMVVAALASLLGTTSAFAGRASGVSSADKVDTSVAPAAVTHATIPSAADSNHAVRIAKLEAELSALRISLNSLIAKTASKP